ncbi:dipeptidase [Bowdeniella nasicola]|uniref:Dipeptidase n=1 Tax=Bowdeniella nasicola TaxID=208480 RepID=A0A1Q5Q3N9_9ACTO|nr:dipeptidase [Bowdeniella nasicola]OKL54250.1 dipeptidase [Bowdeniella nasicola]
MITVEMLKERIDEAFAQVRTDLENLVRIPSVSSPAFAQKHVRASAEYTAELLRGVGMDSVEILSAPDESGKEGAPAVVAHKHGKEGAPRVLLYAHHDVQPPGETAQWDQDDPFEPVTRGDRMFGRGTGDDKAGIVAHVGALRLLGDDLGVNVTCFFEGEEEIGSPSFENFLMTYRDKLEADVIIVLDSANWQVGTPALTTSLRGLVDVGVEVRTGNYAVHSGMFGGPYLDAVTCMSRLIATLHDDAGDVAVEGLVTAPASELDYPEDAWRADAGVVDGYQLAGTGSIPTRLWSKPAISVIGMDVTSIEMKSNTITPSCSAALSMRIVPGQDPREAAEALKAHLEKHAPFGANVIVTINELGQPFDAGDDTEIMRKARWAMSQAWENDAVNIGMGGSIPFISVLAKVFPEAAILITGIEDPDTRAHGANESVHLGELRGATLTGAILLAVLAGDIEAEI